jgi:hypothetical protein
MSSSVGGGSSAWRARALERVYHVAKFGNPSGRLKRRDAKAGIIAGTSPFLRHAREQAVQAGWRRWSGHQRGEQDFG